MRVAVTGASGNVGTQLLRHLLADSEIEAVVGISRQPTEASDPRVSWVTADLADPASLPTLRQAFTGADVVVHLAWIIQPSWDLDLMRAINVDGSQRVFDAAVDVGVGALVYASSIGAYSPGPSDQRVDESWPTGGVQTSAYSRQKAEVERRLDAVEAAHPQLRVVRMRPALIFQRAAASEIARYFLGPLVPLTLVRRSLVPVVPRIPDVIVQAVHADDVGAAYHLAVTRDVRGAFNLAAEPVLDPATLGRLLHARPIPVPAAPVRALMEVTWRLRLQPTHPGWLDLARAVPLLDPTRARTELGWTPRHDAGEALLELLDGMSDKAGGDTPVLKPRATLGKLVRNAGERLRAVRR